MPKVLKRECASFRIEIRDLKNKKSKTISLVSAGKNVTLSEITTKITNLFP